MRSADIATPGSPGVRPPRIARRAWGGCRAVVRPGGPARPRARLLVALCALALSAAIGAADTPVNDRAKAYDALAAQAAAAPNGADAAALLAEAKGDPRRWNDAAAEALCRLHPELRQAMVALADDRIADAQRGLDQLAAKDDPPALAAYARLALARVHALDERYELARPLLERIEQGGLAHLVQADEHAFLAASCAMRMLDREDATRRLRDFLTRHPQAPERMRVGARQMLVELLATQEGSLREVAGRLDYARRRLEQADPGARTQQEQQKAIGAIEKLIAKLEQEEQEGEGGGSGSGSGSGKGQGKGQGKGGGKGGKGGGTPGGGADESAADAGEGSIGRLDRIHAAKAGEEWGSMPQREREAILKALEAQYPERYRELVEQYYKSMQGAKE